MANTLATSPSHKFGDSPWQHAATAERILTYCNTRDSRLLSHDCAVAPSRRAKSCLRQDISANVLGTLADSIIEDILQL